VGFKLFRHLPVVDSRRLARFVHDSGLGTRLPLGKVGYHRIHILDLVRFLAFIIPYAFTNGASPSFVLIKVIMGVYLVSYATRRRAGMEAREAEDVVNDFGRDPIGEGQEERVSSISIFPLTVFKRRVPYVQKYNRELKDILDNKWDDAAQVSEIGELGCSERGVIEPTRDEERKRKRPKLEELTRFTMVKRIW